MVKKANKAKRGKDKYYQLAKEQGYRARSAFKLIQLNKKYDFLSRAEVCVDLCAAPGGWLQVAAKYMPAGSTIVGVDLMPIKPIRGVITHQEDITVPHCRSLLKRDLAGRKADVILHDGAPNVGQNWAKDAFTQSELVLCSLKLATEFLRPHGLFITKVFRSTDYNSLLWVFQQLFGKVEATKPHSSRNASAEIFVVCRDYNAPDKIDPKLLDARYVFKDVDDLTGTGAGVAGGGGAGTLTVMDRRAADHNKRHRDGYDDSLGPLLTRAVSICDFVRHDNPIRVLTDASFFVFDEEAAAAGFTTHPATTAEVRACCEDLKVLGKKEFKLLLKWRFLIRKAFPEALRRHAGVSVPEVDMSDASDDEAAEGSGEEGSDASGTDSDEADVAALSAAAREELRRRRREKKRDTERRNKALRRQRLGLTQSNVDLLNTDNQLFDLSTVSRLVSHAGMQVDDLADVNLDATDEATAHAAASGLRPMRMFGEEEEAATAAAIAAASKAGATDDARWWQSVDLATLEAEDTAEAVAGETLADRLKRQERRLQLTELEDEFDAAYADYLARKVKRESESTAARARGEGPSKGIKLSRREKLEAQALLTEAALNGQIEAEHQRYISLLAGVRNAAAVGAPASSTADEMVALPAVGTKRPRSNSDAAAREVDDDLDSVLNTSEEEGSDAEGEVAHAGAGRAAAGVAAPSAAASSRAARWFSGNLFAGALADEELHSTKLRAMQLPAARGAAGKAAAAAAAAAAGTGAPLLDSEEEESDAEAEAAAAAASKKPASKRARVGEDNDGDAFPDWLAGIPKSDREKRRDTLRKRREREAAAAAKHAAKDSIQLVANGAVAEEDADTQFARAVAAMGGGSASAGMDVDSDDAPSADENEEVMQGGMTRAERRGRIRAGMGARVQDDEGGDIEVVAGSRRGVADTDSEDDSDEDSESEEEEDDPRMQLYDPDTHAEMLALGKLMRRHTSAKKLVDASYNRYSFDDTGVPAWFAADESRHFRPQLPVSQEEVAAMRDRFRDIAARPLARVAEARARKRYRATQRLAKAKRQAENVLESEELQGRSKTKALARIYKAQERTVRKKTEFVVSSRAGTHASSANRAKRGGGPVRMVDPREKKDLRAAKFASRGKGGGGGGAKRGGKRSGGRR